jgi:hypothetical protein
LAVEEGESRGAAAGSEGSGGKWRSKAVDSATRKGEG